MLGIAKVYSQSKSYDYCYVNKKGICVYSLMDKKEYLVVKKGTDPCISPDGTKVAYTSMLNGIDRVINVIDLNTKKITKLNTNSINCYGAMWSPDGKYIAYNVFNLEKSRWYIAIIDAANTSFKILTEQLEQCYAPTWSADSQAVVIQNIDNVHIFDLSGNINNTYKVSDITKTLGPSSSDRFVLTPDRKKIVFSTEVDEPGYEEGPPTAVYAYDIASRSTVRLSPKGYYGRGVIIKNNKVLFSGGKVTSTIENTYTVDLDGKNLKVLFPNANTISAKN